MDLEKAKNILSEGEYTCVLCRGDETVTTDRRGIAPLLDWLDGGELRPGFSAADKAVGKAPACIYALLGAKAVYGRLMTDAAIEIFEHNGIAYEYGLRVPMIRNRADTDFCPVELAVKELSDPQEIVTAAKKRLAALNR